MHSSLETKTKRFALIFAALVTFLLVQPPAVAQQQLDALALAHTGKGSGQLRDGASAAGVERVD